MITQLYVGNLCLHLYYHSPHKYTNHRIYHACSVNSCLIGGRWYIITQLAVYTTYILPSGELYATYHLLWEPETTIDSGTRFLPTSQSPNYIQKSKFSGPSRCHENSSRNRDTCFFGLIPSSMGTCSPPKKTNQPLFTTYWESIVAMHKFIPTFLQPYKINHSNVKFSQQTNYNHATVAPGSFAFESSLRQKFRSLAKGLTFRELYTLKTIPNLKGVRAIREDSKDLPSSRFHQRLGSAGLQEQHQSHSHSHRRHSETLGTSQRSTFPAELLVGRNFPKEITA